MTIIMQPTFNLLSDEIMVGLINKSECKQTVTGIQYLVLHDNFDENGAYI